MDIQKTLDNWELVKDLRREMERDWYFLKTIKEPLSDEIVEDSAINMILMYLVKKGVIK